ncbi:MAG: CotH kinase family protein [Bacteroidales bacterium]
MASLNRSGKIILLQIALLLPAISVSFGQAKQTEGEPLNLTDRGDKIQNTICLYISASDFENIKAVTGREISVNPRLLIINNDTLTTDKISTRGQTTLFYRRKSYSFDLKSDALFHHGKKTRKLKKFYLLGLSMDRNYANNRLAFEMMESAKLFHLFYTYCELRINGQSEGICMIMERPDDWALQKKDSPLLLRRGYNSSINKLKAGNKADKEIIKKYRANFREIYRSLDKYEGEELYRTISAWLDTDAYMKWLAFNYFIRNGDYTDEVYFFADPGTGKFNVIPWDYDDIFSVAPHEGYEESRKITGEKLFFSAEDLLDKKIVTDPYLYKMYLIQFEELLNELSPDVLKHIFERTYAELYPYYSNDEIISQSKYDRHKDVNMEGLRNDMSSFYDHLVISRVILLQAIASR